MKKLFLILVCCSFLMSCKDDEQKYDYPAWVAKELSTYTLGMLYSIEQNGALYYGIHDGKDSSLTMTLRLFNENGTEIKEGHDMHAALKELFVEGKFNLCHIGF